LDYINVTPSILRDRRRTLKEHTRILYRRNILKNVVYRIIIKIRDIKKRPKLGDVLAAFNDKKNPNAK